MDYYKRSPFLFSYWNKQNKLIVYNYNRYTKAIISQDIVRILEILPEWANVEEILNRLKDFDKNNLKKALEHLTKINIIHKKPLGKEDDNISHRTQWSPVELAMQRQMSHVDLFSKTRNRKRPLSPIKYVKGLSTVILPKPQPRAEPKRALLDVLDERRSIRKYDRSFLDLTDLSDFLYRCARIKTVLKGQVLWGAHID